jgi:hypothetical protein
MLALALENGHMYVNYWVVKAVLPKMSTDVLYESASASAPLITLINTTIA